MKDIAIVRMRDYLARNCMQYDDAINMMVAKREKGKVFSIEDHVAALIYAQLTNQTKWSRIVPHLQEIDQLFFHYDISEIKKKSATYFSEGIFKLHCGNISTKAQMNSLHYNIGIMERICEEYGSMDGFVLSAPTYQIIEAISSAKSKYKMKQLGEALAWEYIRNVGIDACKPDTHLRRFLGNARMGNADGEIATVEETLSQVEKLSNETGYSLATIDNIIWSFCADGYGEVCTATPHCERCVVRQLCNYSSGKETLLLRSFSYDEIRCICKEHNNDPVAIGKFFLELVSKE